MVGSGLVAAGLWAVVPGIIHPISTDAVLNAEVVTVRSPVDGVLDGAGLAVGDRVRSGQQVGWVKPFRTDTSRRDQLTLDLAAQSRLAEALATEVAALEAFDRSLSAETGDFRKAALAGLEHSLAEARAQLEGASAEAARAAAELERKRVLMAKDLVAPAALQTAEAESRGARAEAEAARANLARLTAEHAAARRGTYVAGGVNNVPYSRQRLDEVRLKLLERRSQLAAARVRVTELDGQLATAEKDLIRLSDAPVTTPAAGVVWQRFAGEGDGLRSGDAVLGLVDCRTLYLTAVLPRRYFAELKAGDRAGARLAGGPGEVEAVVQSVRAAGGGQASTAWAVTPDARDKQDVVVTLVVEGSRFGSRSDNLCQVGQRATVTFRMPGLAPLVSAVAGVVGRGFGGG
jgi:multidrug resistance efflux pump